MSIEFELSAPHQRLALLEKNGPLFDENQLALLGLTGDRLAMYLCGPDIQPEWVPHLEERLRGAPPAYLQVREDLRMAVIARKIAWLRRLLAAPAAAAAAAAQKKVEDAIAAEALTRQAHGKAWLGLGR